LRVQIYGTFLNWQGLSGKYLFYFVKRYLSIHQNNLIHINSVPTRVFSKILLLYL